MDATNFAASAVDAYKASPAGGLTVVNVPTPDTGGEVPAGGASLITSLAKKASSLLQNLVPSKLDSAAALVPGSKALTAATQSASKAAEVSAKGVAQAAKSVATKISWGAGLAVFVVVLVFGVWIFSTIKNAGRV